jgi:hypothetical protein
MLGLGLSATCGIRVFLPLLVMSICARAQIFAPSEGFEWIGSWITLVTLCVACMVEVAAYSVPVIDHALDVIKVPAAFIAGTLAAASHMGDFHPVIGWSTALIAGGGLASSVHATVAAARVASGVSTGGLANPVFATIESVVAAVSSVLVLVFPVIFGALVASGLVTLALLYVLIRRRRRRVLAGA